MNFESPRLWFAGGDFLVCYFFVKFLQKSLQKISAYVKITSNANDKKITIIAKHDL